MKKVFSVLSEVIAVNYQLNTKPDDDAYGIPDKRVGHLSYGFQIALLNYIYIPNQWTFYEQIQFFPVNIID